MISVLLFHSFYLTREAISMFPNQSYGRNHFIYFLAFEGIVVSVPSGQPTFRLKLEYLRKQLITFLLF
jgi:hypothetical protein